MSTVLRTFGLVVAILLAGVFAPSVRAAERLPPVHLVFDIDWTLTSNIPPEDVAKYAGDPRFFEVGGKYYRFSNGVDVALNRLLEYNRRLGYEYVKISFFSGGTRRRNEALLRKIVLDRRSGKTAFDIAEKILSFEDLDDLYPHLPQGQSEIRFADRYDKNLIQFFKDLNRTIAIDDTERFFQGDETASLLWIGATYADFRTYGEALRAQALTPAREFLPPDFAAWLTDQNRVLLAALQLEYALDSEIAASKSRAGAGKLAFRERVQTVHRKYSKTELFERLKKRLSPTFLNACPEVFFP
jgi:hypothetical protein